MASKIVHHDPVLGPLTCDLLTRDVRIFQRAKGHRFSSDDVATAYVAFATRPEASRVLDLGCGIGSVLLLLAWKLPTAELAGIEAQPMSFELLRRNVELSGFGARVRVTHGDLRDERALAPLGGPYDLVTGTPPYFPPDAALDAEDEQRAFARIEYRGGVEAYIGAAAPLMAPGGALVLCGDARVGERTKSAAELAGLHLRARCDVVARAGRPALFSIWTLCREAGTSTSSSLVLRGPGGESAEGATRLREFSGFVSASS
jgi:tRNA1Val (adenine37-N6)-methyltransferase